MLTWLLFLVVAVCAVLLQRRSPPHDKPQPLISPTIEPPPSSFAPLKTTPSTPKQAPAEYLELLTSKRQQLIEEAFSGSGWNKIEEDENFVSEKKEHPGFSVPFLRGTGVVSASPLEIYTILDDISPDGPRSVLDPPYIGGRWLEDYGAIRSCHLEFSGLGPVQGRDFHILSFVDSCKDLPPVPSHLLPQGWCTDNTRRSIVEIDISSPFGSLATSPKFVRGHTEISGFILRPISHTSTGRTATLVSYLALVDLKGNIPGFILRRVVENQPRLVVRLQQLVARTALQVPNRLNWLRADSDSIHESKQQQQPSQRSDRFSHDLQPLTISSWGELALSTQKKFSVSPRLHTLTPDQQMCYRFVARNSLQALITDAQSWYGSCLLNHCLISPPNLNPRCIMEVCGTEA